MAGAARISSKATNFLRKFKWVKIFRRKIVARIFAENSSSGVGDF